MSAVICVFSLFLSIFSSDRCELLQSKIYVDNWASCQDKRNLYMFSQQFGAILQHIICIGEYSSTTCCWGNYICISFAPGFGIMYLTNSDASFVVT